MKYARLLLSCLLGWWPMMAVHELGHVIGCAFTGAKIHHVILWPWTISQTIRTESAVPLVDTWFGPTFGALAPAAVYLFCRARRTSVRRILGFFAGFCLIANGAYIGAGWIDRVGDAGDLLRHGSPKYALILGDVFSLKYGPGTFLFGRIIALDVGHGGFERGCIRIHIYKQQSSTGNPPPGFIDSGLLIPPQHINQLGFTRGFMPVVAHQPLAAIDDRGDVCYLDAARKRPTYLDENGVELAGPRSIIGLWGLGNYLTIDELISDSLRIPRAE